MTAARLADHRQVRAPEAHAQSLSLGAAGIALLHIERAAAGAGSWSLADDWLAASAAGPICAGSQATLLFGAPALTFALHGAARPGRYGHALHDLDAQVAILTRRRLDEAHARIDSGGRPRLAEFDLFKGLTGLGAHLLRRAPCGDLLPEVLTYLVRLTEPLGPLPGWWTDEPATGSRARSASGGHGNLSMAHGISGPLALLSLAIKRGVTVPGQIDAIKRICAWMDAWRQDGDGGAWWPEIVTRQDVDDGCTRQARPLRPSWCYGIAGHARAQQLAGQATADRGRRRIAEQAFIGCLNEPAQLDHLTDPGLCHGWAGLLQTGWRMAADAEDPALPARLRGLTCRLVPPPPGDPRIGFLAGTAGVALALFTASGRQPASGWDTCLLLN